MAMRRLLATTSSDAFLVEPDAGAKILANYAILAPERITVRLLADEEQYRPSLIRGIQRWQQRFGDRRNLLVRVAPGNTLHERLILLDAGRAWVLGAPFSQLAKRTHTTLVRMRPEEEARKISDVCGNLGGGQAFVTARLSIERAYPECRHKEPLRALCFIPVLNPTRS